MHPSPFVPPPPSHQFHSPNTSNSQQFLDLLSYALSSLLPPVFVGFFHGGALIFMLLYLWSRQNPEAQVSLH